MQVLEISLLFWKTCHGTSWCFVYQLVHPPGGGESLLSLSFQSAVWLMASTLLPPSAPPHPPPLPTSPLPPPLPQGSQPHQGHPAAAGAPCGPAAPHLQLPEGPPDREGSPPSVGRGRRRLGCRWRLPEGAELGWGGGALRGEQWGRGKNTTEGQKKKLQINQKRKGHSISPERRRCVQVASVIYCTVTHFHPLVLISVTAGTAVSYSPCSRVFCYLIVCCCVFLLVRCTALHSYSL